MGRRIVKMTTEIFTQFMTQGAKWPDENGRGLECVSGLPPDARLVKMSMELYLDQDIVACMFESSEWPDTLEGCQVPELKIEFSSFEPSLCVAASE